MARFENMKRYIALSLHRWLVKLRLLNDPWRNRQSTDSMPEMEFKGITMQKVSYLVVEQPGDVTIEDPVRIVKDTSEQVTIEDPNRVLIDGDPVLLIDNPTTVTVHNRGSVMLKDSNEQSRIVVPSETADESGLFVFPHLNQVRAVNAEKLTFGWNS